MDAAGARDARGDAPLTVLVPDETGLEQLAALDGVRAVRYDPRSPDVPTGGEDA